MKRSANNPGLVHLVLLAGLGASSCAGAPPHEPASPAPVWRELPEYRMLAGAETFECSAVGEAGDTPLSAVAFARLVLRDDAPQVFDDLLRQESLVAQLYGLKGLWFTDRERYRRESALLAARDEEVFSFRGCILGDVPLSSLVKDSPDETLFDWCGAVELFRSGTAWLEAADPRGDGAAEWRSTLLAPQTSEDSRLWSARALAYSLDGPGLEALLGCLPALDPELRLEILELLDRIPPWCQGTLAVVTAALDRDDRLVQLGALRAARSLTTYPWSRRECHALVPRLGALLAAFAPGAGDSGEDLDQQYVSGLWVALARIGGPAGPVLARAVAHRERIFRDQIELPYWDLGAWGEATIAELGRLLEHPEADARANVFERLSYAMTVEPPVPPDVRAAIRNLEPALRRAIATLDEARRDELTADLDQALGRVAPRDE